MSDFEYEILEVIHNLEDILAEYGFADTELNQDEFLQLMAELLPLAEQFEFREAAHLGLQDDPLISQIPERNFSLRMGVIERKLTRAQSHTSVMIFLQRLALA